MSIPEVTLASGGRGMPVIGMGSSAYPFDQIEFKTAVLESIKIGYRHFDTASVYGSEKALGEALAEAMERKLVTREDLFVTSKLWPSDAHPHLVASALQISLRSTVDHDPIKETQPLLWRMSIPEVTLASGGRGMPVIGMGSAASQLDQIEFKTAVLESIKLGYRHFDTASLYGSEKALGEALAEAMELKLVTREDLFVTSKLWPTDAHPHLVASVLQKSLRTLQLEYLDLYLIHWPFSCKPVEEVTFVAPVAEDLVAMDYKGVWEAMEECQRRGLTRSIGVSNYSCKKLGQLLSFATIPPSVNQVEMNPVWQQRKLLDFCKANGVVVTAYSPLGAKGTPWGSNNVMENETLNQIAESHGKSVAQVCLRWIYEQGATFVVKSFNKERMKQNLEIFNWELREEDYEKMSKIPQKRHLSYEPVVSPHGLFKSLDELWDGEI